MNRQGIAASILPFTAAGEGETSYTTFLDCYNSVLKDDAKSKKADENKQLQAMKDWFAKNGVVGLQKMEEELSCGGACRAPLFYVTRPITDTPEDTCFNAMFNKLGSGHRTAGIVSLITALISFTAFCGSFPLCKGYDDKEGE